MAASLTGSIASLILKVDDPDRDDLTTVKVWASTTNGFTPSDLNLVYIGNSFTIIIANLIPLTTYYVKFAYISEIDPTDFDISAQLSGTPNKIDGSIIVDGSITANQISATALRGKIIAGSNLVVKGSQVSANLSFASSTTQTTFTINLLDTTDFHSSGLAAVYTSTYSDPIFFTYTGKTSTSLTGCSGFNFPSHRGVNIGNPVLALSSSAYRLNTSYTSGADLFVGANNEYMFRVSGGTAISFSPTVVADEFTYSGRVSNYLDNVSGLVSFTGERYIVDDIGFPRHTAASTTVVSSMTFTSSTTMVGTLFNANGGQCIIIPLAGTFATKVNYISCSSTSISFSSGYNVTSGRSYVIIPIITNELVSDIANGYVSIDNTDYLNWAYSSVGSVNSINNDLLIKKGNLYISDNTFERFLPPAIYFQDGSINGKIVNDTGNGSLNFEVDGMFQTVLFKHAGIASISTNQYGLSTNGNGPDSYPIEIVKSNNGILAGSEPNNVLAFVDSDLTSTTGQPVGRIAFVTKDLTASGTNAYIEGRSESTSAPGSLHFGTGAPDSAVDRLTINSSGNVGIGITPTQKLHVSGNILSTGSIDAGTQFLGQANDTVSAPSFSWTGDTNCGLYRPAADTIGIVTNGAERAIVNATGTNFTGVVSVKNAALSTSISLNIADSMTVNGTRRGAYSNIAFTNATLTADRSLYAAQNVATLTSVQNSASFSHNVYGAWNQATADIDSGNSVDNEGNLYGAYNYGLHNTDNATFTRMEDVYGSYNYAQSAGDTSRVDDAFGVFARVSTSGTAASPTLGINRAHGLYSQITSGTNRTIGTAYNLYLTSTETGTITTKWGIFQNNTWPHYLQGNINVVGALNLIPTVSAPASGATITLTTATTVLCLNHTATIATLTINFPSSPEDGQCISICSRSNVTTLTLGNGTFRGAITSFSAGAGAFVEYIYSTTGAAWFRKG